MGVRGANGRRRLGLLIMVSVMLYVYSSRVCSSRANYSKRMMMGLVLLLIS